MSQLASQTKQENKIKAAPESGILQRAAISPTITPVHSGILQRCSNGVECAECRAKRLERESLQRAAVSPAPMNTVPPIVHDVLNSPGQSLDAGARAFMEPRFGHDFSGVRVHTDARAAEFARSVNALAYTVGRNVIFGTGQYAPETGEGRKLLAHELTHVVQQRFGIPIQGRLETGPSFDQHEWLAEEIATQISQSEELTPLTSTTSLRLQRQGAPHNIFSVDQAAYLQLVNRAMQQIGGRLVTSDTLAGSIKPILQAMLAQVTWRDQTGADYGGGIIQYPLPGRPPLALNLHLVLDDQLLPPDAGQFTHTGARDGTMFIRIRNNSTVDELTLTLFHEAEHMMAWIINRAGPSRVDSLVSPDVRALTLSRFSAPIKNIRRQLGVLAQSVNSKRQVAGQSPITNAELDDMAPWLLEEILVRAETEVFRLLSEVQRQRATQGPHVFIGTPQNIEVNWSIVNNYVFDFSHKFLPGDRAGLTTDDKSILQTLSQMLERIFQRQVRRRFSLAAYEPVSRPEIKWEPPPLAPPTFTPLPLPTD